MKETLVGRMIRTQKENLRNANNQKFTLNGNEYRIEYCGGLAEFVSIYGRRVGATAYKYITGFNAYKMNDKEQVVTYAKNLIIAKSNNLKNV